MDVLDSVDVTSWQDFLTDIPEASFYYTPHWYKLVTQTYPKFTMIAKKFIFGDNTSAIIPFLKTKKGLLFRKKIRLKSGGFGVEGGILSNRRLSVSRENQIYSYLTKTKASLSITTNPFSGGTLPDYFSTHSDFTQIIQLPAEDQSPNVNYSRGAKSNLKQALKKGLTVRTAKTHKDISAYYSIYQDTLKRWGDRALSTYPEDLFYRIFDLSRDLAKIWLVEHDNRIIAGAVIFYFNEIASYWHGSSLQDYFSYYPNNLLQTEIMKDAAKHYKYYDMGQSGGQKGVERFKKSLGAKIFPLTDGIWKHRWKNKK